MRRTEFKTFKTCGHCGSLSNEDDCITVVVVDNGEGTDETSLSTIHRNFNLFLLQNNTKISDWICNDCKEIDAKNKEKYARMDDAVDSLIKVLDYCQEIGGGYQVDHNRGVIGEHVVFKFMINPFTKDGGQMFMKFNEKMKERAIR